MNKMHCAPYTGFKIRAMAVWDRARYLSVTEASHNIESLRVSRKETYCFFETWRPEWWSNPWSPTFPSSQLAALCSEGSMFRRFYVQKIFVQKVLCSESSIFRRSYVQKVLCSEGSIFRRFYVQKVLCSENFCSKGPIFRRFYVQKVLYSDMFRRSYIQKSLCFMLGQTYL